MSLLRPVVSVTLNLTTCHTMTVHAVAAYEEPITSLILAKRYSNKVASIQLGQLMLEHIARTNLAYDYITPVPIYWRRYAQRGFNQAEIIAGVLSRASGKELISVLKRTRHTPFQFLLTGASRQANVAHAFVIDMQPDHYADHHYKDKDILLVDDVMTTGATLRAIGTALLELKPRSITAVVAARVI